jgi:hypothetical protein
MDVEKVVAKVVAKVVTKVVAKVAKLVAVKRPWRISGLMARTSSSTSSSGSVLPLAWLNHENA